MIKGSKHSKETIDKVSLNNARYWKGKKRSKDVIQKMIEGRKSKPFSIEHRKKLSEAKKGKPSRNKGKKMSETHRNNLSKAKKGKSAYRNTGLKRSEEVRKKISERFKGKKLSQEHICKIIKSREGYRHSNDTKKKLSVAKVLDKNPQWKGGLSFQTYTIDWTHTLRKSIRERDQYKCRICGEQQGDIAHDVHHIDYNKDNCNINNLITLCRSCHAKTNINRDKREKILSSQNI